MNPSSAAVDPAQYNNADHRIQSFGDTLVTFTHSTEIATINHPQRHVRSSKSRRSSIRRSVKNLSNTRKSQGRRYCKTCNITCYDYGSYQRHLYGSKHERNKLLQQSFANRRRKTAAARIFRCKLCDITCTCSYSYEQHLNGSKHKKVMKLRRTQCKTKPSKKPRKVKSKFVVEENFSDPSERKQISNHPLHEIDYPSEIDADTNYLMMLDERITPSPNVRNLIETFVSAVESALKSCSEELQRLSIDGDFDSIVSQFPLIGVSRVGLLGKNLLTKDDRLFHIVVLCTEWPTKRVFQTIGEILLENFDKQWKGKIRIQCHLDKEMIELETNTEEGRMNILIAFTSLFIQEEQERYESNEFLSKINCLKALDAIHSTQSFQNQLSTRQYASELIRCLRSKANNSIHWRALSSEAIEYLVDYAFSQSSSMILAFRTILECLSGGLILSNGLGLRTLWQTDSIKVMFENLNNQERNDITQEAQFGLSLLSFGQLVKWFEQSTGSQALVILPQPSHSSDTDN